MAIKPTHKEPTSPQSEKFEKDFKKTMIKTGAPAIHESETMLNEVDGLLSEAEQSLKKKIFSLAKMEALVFADPKLATVYENMAENGEEKYGYHYNETIQNMIFNDYVLNSPQYLQKYKMAIPKEKKRRDKSGINKLKKAGAAKMDATGTKLNSPETNEVVNEGDEGITKVVFLIHPNHEEVFAYFPEEKHDVSGKYMTGYAHVGQHTAVDPNYARECRTASPEEYQDLKVELEGIGYNLEVLNDVQESTGAASSGAFTPALGSKEHNVYETDSSSSGQYSGPGAWSTKGDLSGDFKGKKEIDSKAKPISKVMSIGESQYLTDPSGFEKYVDALNEETDAAFIGKHGSNTYGSVDNMNPENQKIIRKDIQNGKLNSNANIKDGIALQEYLMRDALFDDEIVDSKPRNGEHPFTMGDNGDKYEYMTVKFANGRQDIAVYSHKDDVFYDYMKWHKNMGIDENTILQEKAKSKSQQRFMGMVNAYKNGDLGDGDVSADIERAADSMTDTEVDDFASTKHKGLPNHVDETMGQPDIEYLTKAFEIINSGPNYDPAKAEAFKNNLIQMDDAQAQQISRRFEGMLKQMGYTNPQQVMSFQNKFNEDTQTMIQNNGTSMSNKSQATGDMSSDTPMGAQAGGMNESDTKLLEEINNELEAFSIHHDKLKIMSEERKTTSQILNQRVTDQNPSNFKKDMQHSGTKDILDVEKQLEWEDQQTDVGKDPQKLGADIEKQAIKNSDMNSDEALKNVGNSANNKGDEIPKRNLTTKEQAEVDLYRNGQHSLTYDNEPDERFVERMKADQGEFFEMGEKQKEFKEGAPLYDKEEQPVGKTNVDKVQFDKNVKKKGDDVAWNERLGLGSNVKLAESMISGRFTNEIGSSHIIDFKMSDVTGEVNEEATKDLFSLDFTGLGNKYLAKTVDNKVIVNEAVVGVMEAHKFFTNGKEVFAMKNPVQAINEAEEKKTPVINEEQEKMKHLLGYKPENYVSTKGTKQNRKF